MRPLREGQIWAYYDPGKMKITKRYLIRSVMGNDAVCDVLDANGKPCGALRVMLPDNNLVRFESGPLAQIPIPIDKETEDDISRAELHTRFPGGSLGPDDVMDSIDQSWADDGSDPKEE